MRWEGAKFTTGPVSGSHGLSHSVGVGRQPDCRGAGVEGWGSQRVRRLCQGEFGLYPIIRKRNYGRFLKLGIT